LKIHFNAKLFFVVFVLDSVSLAQAKQDVVQSFAFPDLHLFKPVWLMIATWSNVTSKGSASTAIVSIIA
jgi:hypothetical protein